MKKYTEASDDAYDKKHGIKEGSKRDMALDKKRGIKEDMKGAKKIVKKALKKKVHVVVIAPKKMMKGKTPMPIPVPMPMGPAQKPIGRMKNPSIYR